MIHRDPTPNPHWWVAPALVAAALLAFAIVGTMDYQDAERERAHYCAMVEAGHWPDYKNLRGECENDNAE